MGDNNSPTEHEDRASHSLALLRAAKQKAIKQRIGGYSSSTYRSSVTRALLPRFNRRHPYNWQLDISEAIELGLDCLLISGTGSGKTLPFVLPIIGDLTRTKKVVIISPLLALEEDQVASFTKLGLAAVAVNGETWDDNLKEVRASDFLLTVI